MAHRTLVTEMSRREVVRAAYLERQVSLQTAVGGGPDATLMEQAAHVPRWFGDVELGLSLAHGPSIFATARSLETTNRRHAKQLEARPPDEGESEQPARARVTAADRKKAWGKVLGLSQKALERKARREFHMLRDLRRRSPAP